MLALKSRPSWLTFALVQIILILAVALGLVLWKSQQTKPVAMPQQTIVQRVIAHATGQLDRGTALELLKAHPDKISPADTTGFFLSGTPRQHDALTAFLVARGLAECHATTYGAYHWPTTSCSLTAAGKRQNWHADPVGTQGAYRVSIPLAVAVPEKISGIQSGIIGAVAGQAIADYTFTVQPNDLGKQMLRWLGNAKFGSANETAAVAGMIAWNKAANQHVATTRTYCGINWTKVWNGQHQQGQALMSRYDDGYRLTQAAKVGVNPFEGAANTCAEF